MAMYIFVPPFREAKFCGVPSRVVNKLGCAAGEKRLRNTGLESYNSANQMRGCVCDAQLYTRTLKKQKPFKVMSIVVFWVVTPGRLVGGYQRFEGTYRLYLQHLFPRLNRNDNILECWAGAKLPGVQAVKVTGAPWG
jgi:hypothetical protein